MLLLLLLLCFAFECLEPDVPEALQEVPELDQALRSRPVEAPGAVASLGHEPRLLQDVQMLRDRRPRDIEVRCDLPGAQLAVADEREDLPSPRLGDCFQRRFHARYLSICF